MLPIRRNLPGSLPDRLSDPERLTDLTPMNRGIDGRGLPAHLSPDIQARGLARAAETRRCLYIKPSGERCGSPAMRELDLCYYHDRYQPKPGYRNLPCLEDPHSVQCAIQEIIEDMLNGLLDYKKAALALYGLQTAASNLKQMRIAEEKARSVQRSACSEREKTCPVAGAQCTEPSREATDGFSPARSAGNVDVITGESRRDDWDSFGGARLQPCRKHPDNDPASAAEVRLSDVCSYDETEEIELVAGSDDNQDSSASTASSCVHSCLPTTNDQRPTTFIESPRQPQHVKFGLTSAERRRMKEVFPDVKKIREEYLSMLTSEERAQVEARQAPVL